jgi:GNAT superfamily N-acetyltransferase
MRQPQISLEPDPAPVAAQISAALGVWNERQAGPPNFYRFALAIRDRDELVAGLVGEVFWTSLYVAELWVGDAHRGRGYGRALLSRAEEIAEARGCEVAYLSTFAFQAPGFYPKCGYAPFGSLPHVPTRLERTWFAKRIAPGETTR